MTLTVDGKLHAPRHNPDRASKCSLNVIHTIFTAAETGLTAFAVANREYVVCLMAAGILTFHIGFIYAACIQKRYD